MCDGMLNVVEEHHVLKVDSAVHDDWTEAYLKSKIEYMEKYKENSILILHMFCALPIQQSNGCSSSK